MLYVVLGPTTGEGNVTSTVISILHEPSSNPSARGYFVDESGQLLPLDAVMDEDELFLPPSGLAALDLRMAVTEENDVEVRANG